MDSPWLSWVAFVPAVGLWCAALAPPALRAPGPGASFHYTGLHCLLLGWIGLFGKPEWALPWLANVLYWISLIWGIFRREPGREALVLSLIAIPLALITLVHRTIETNEAGDRTAVVVGPAFYLWVASMVALAAAQFFASSAPRAAN